LCARSDGEKRELEFKDEDQEYAQVSKMLGNGRLEATCFDGTSRLCHIRGKFRKRVWINAGDIVLLGLREYQDGKADVIHRYSPEEARTLKAYGEIPERVIIGGFVDGEDEEGDGAVAFGGEGSDSSDSDAETKGAKGKDGKEEEVTDWAKALDEL
jgi:translation initiation factor 1A